MKSLNRVQILGNVTADPVLRYTNSGQAVCEFRVATNRSWTTDSGEKHEDAEFHRVVAWTKLAELTSQLLHKGSRVYIEGRLQTREWLSEDGTKHSATEIVAGDFLVLDKPTNVETKGGEDF